MTKKKLLATLLALCVVLQLSAGFTPAAEASNGFAGGSGTSSDPYKIANPIQLQLMGSHVDNKYFILTDDIIVPAGAWTPIGGSSTSARFKGTLYGNNKTITLTNVTVPSGYAGLFAYASGLSVYDLTIKGIIDGTYAGSIVARAYGTLILTNCRSEASVKGTGYTGGLVGYAEVVHITKCGFSGMVTSSHSETGGIIGGKTDSRDGSYISQSYNTGNISGTNVRVGGIAGNFIGDITQCYSTGNIKGDSSSVGGIVGNLRSKGIVENCYSSGTVKGSSYVGGIVGHSWTGSSTHKAYIRNCYSSADVTGESTGSAASAGGIVGALGNTSPYTEITNCAAINAGVISNGGSNSTVGRIIGQANPGSTSYYANNYARDDMVVKAKGNPVAVASSKNGMHGETKPLGDFKLQSTYANMGWDFTSVWIMDSTVSTYPVLRWNWSNDEEIKISVQLNIGETRSYIPPIPNTYDSVKSRTSSNTAVTTVAGTGNTVNITGASAGTATVTVTTTNGNRIIYAVTVLPSTVTLSPKPMTLDIGESGQLTVTRSNPNDSVTGWASSDPSVSVANGYVTANFEGTATITVTTKHGAKDTCIVTVNPPPVDPELDALCITLEEDETLRLSGLTADLNVKDGITWSSGSPGVASVDANGKVTANSVGLTKVSAVSSAGKEVYLYISVIPKTIIITKPDPQFISDMAWISSSCGTHSEGYPLWRDRNLIGDPILLNGIEYTKGIGTASFNDNDIPADIVVGIGAGYTTFSAIVGVDDAKEGAAGATVVFQVLGDGILLAETPVMTAGDIALPITCDISGVSTLTLRVMNGGDGYDFDWANWANARIFAD